MSEPMSDLISRQAAIDAIRAVPEGNWSREKYAQEIMKVPTAQQWIPCSERLPEEYSEYLVCYTTDDAVGLLWLDDTGESKAIVKKYNILAWMSAPKPYKGEERQ